MKKLFAQIALMVMFIGPACARDSITRDSNVLPAEAKSILKTYYPKTQVNHIKIDSKTFGGNEYDVILADGTELDFDNDGKLKEIDCGMNAVPDGLVLKPIREYIAKNFNGQKISSLEIKSRKYDVELMNGVDLEFDRAGNFIRIDD